MRAVAIIGDGIVLGVLSVVGFAMHETMTESSRLLVTVLSFLVAWTWIAPWFGVFGDDVLTDPRRVWRVLLAWVAAAPFGVVLRAFLLGLTVSPIFVIVMTVVTGVGLIVWREILAWRFGARSAPTV
ncbi:MAG TPA: DUF3054 domain-containing protein [Actinobacteria bacterium]|nr:hypothetical protein BMS3Bbin01_01825 [bacterium BMS3Bbin01]HDH25235.1 DUF3054 domain-containing protein [Actinomycetota bacterium]